MVLSFIHRVVVSEKVESIIDSVLELRLAILCPHEVFLQAFQAGVLAAIVNRCLSATTVKQVLNRVGRARPIANLFSLPDANYTALQSMGSAFICLHSVAILTGVQNIHFMIE